MPSHRILYAGDDIKLPARLGDGLRDLDCFMVRSPVLIARTLIQSDIRYSLFLFDKTAAGEELKRHARTLSHRAHTPVILSKELEDPDSLLDVIWRRLGLILLR